MHSSALSPSKAYLMGPFKGYDGVLEQGPLYGMLGLAVATSAYLSAAHPVVVCTRVHLRIANSCKACSHPCDAVTCPPLLLCMLYRSNSVACAEPQALLKPAVDDSACSHTTSACHIIPTSHDGEGWKTSSASLNLSPTSHLPSQRRLYRSNAFAGLCFRYFSSHRTRELHT